MTRREFLYLTAGAILSLFLRSSPVTAQYEEGAGSFDIVFPLAFDGSTQTATPTTILSFRSLTFWDKIFGTARTVSR